MFHKGNMRSRRIKMIMAWDKSPLIPSKLVTTIFCHLEIGRTISVAAKHRLSLRRSRWGSLEKMRKVALPAWNLVVAVTCFQKVRVDPVSRIQGNTWRCSSIVRKTQILGWIRMNICVEMIRIQRWSWLKTKWNVWSHSWKIHYLQWKTDDTWILLFSSTIITYCYYHYHFCWHCLKV